MFIDQSRVYLLSVLLGIGLILLINYKNISGINKIVVGVVIIIKFCSKYHE